jgi:hypothetical protein
MGNSVNFMEALQFPLNVQDSGKATKILILIVCLFIPILGWMVLAGYSIRLTRNVINGVQVLPEFDDWGGDFMRGLMVTIGGLIYGAPSIALSCIVGVLGSSDNGAIIALSCLFRLAQFVYGILIIPFVVSATARYAVNEDFNAFLDFGGRINDVTSRTGDAVMLVVQYIILGIVVSIVAGIGLLLCCIPGLIVIAASYLMSAHLVGQWGRVLGLGGGATFMAPGTPIQPLS